MANLIVRWAKYLGVGLAGIFVGLVPWIVFSSLIALIVSRTDLNMSIPFVGNLAMDQMVSIMGLLLAFLVTANISISGQISAGVDTITGAATELAALTYTLLGDDASCHEEANDLSNFALDMLELTRKSTTTTGETANSSTMRAFRAVHTLKSKKIVEAPLVGVLVKGITGVTAAHGSLWTLRNSGAHPAIRITLFMIAAINIMVNISSLAIEDERALVGTSIFIACSSVGIFTISLFIRDPLDYSILAGKLGGALNSAAVDIRRLRDGQTAEACPMRRATFTPLNTAKTYEALPQERFFKIDALAA